jgi:hypothetical protein
MSQRHASFRGMATISRGREAAVSNALGEVLPQAKLQGVKSAWTRILHLNSDSLSLSLSLSLLYIEETFQIYLFCPYTLFLGERCTQNKLSIIN